MLRFLWKGMSLLVCIGLAACGGATAGAIPSSGNMEPDPPTTQPTVAPVALEDMGPAPELNNQVWLNTDHPLRLKDLRGKVVLIDMWTFGCINCRHVIPSLRSWYQSYGDKGLVIIGNHYPEFSYEADLDNLKQALVDLDVPYPVAQDNQGQTWRAYENRFWPTLYLIDKKGHIRYQHIGEGAYAQSEAAIQALLAEPYPG